MFRNNTSHRVLSVAIKHCIRPDATYLKLRMCITLAFCSLKKSLQVCLTKFRKFCTLERTFRKTAIKAKS